MPEGSVGVEDDFMAQRCVSVGGMGACRRVIYIRNFRFPMGDVVHGNLCYASGCRRFFLAAWHCNWKIKNIESGI